MNLHLAIIIYLTAIVLIWALAISLVNQFMAFIADRAIKRWEAQEIEEAERYIRSLSEVNQNVQGDQDGGE